MQSGEDGISIELAANFSLGLSDHASVVPHNLGSFGKLLKFASHVLGKCQPLGVGGISQSIVDFVGYASDLDHPGHVFKFYRYGCILHPYLMRLFCDR